MRLNTKCSIAIHILLVLAEFDTNLKITSEMLAKSVGCNSSAIRSILNDLKKAGIISVDRGIGGSHLLKSPSELTLWDIFSAVDPDGLSHMIGIHPNPASGCAVGYHIEAILEEPYAEIAEAVKRTMAAIPFEQLVNKYHTLVPDFKNSGFTIFGEYVTRDGSD